MKVKLENLPLRKIETLRVPREISLEFSNAMFEQRENEDNTIHYQQEQQFLECVRSGDLDLLKAIIQTNAESSFYMGRMSQNSQLHAQYSFVSAITLVTRSAIQGGMPEMDAYNLSDVYIQKLDHLTNTQEILELFVTAIFDFTGRVRQVKTNQNAYTYQVSHCMAYINSHLQQPISLGMIAKVCNLSPSYLSTLFRKETGITVSNYLLNARLESSKQLLAYTNYGISEIANLLTFSSHSNFTEHFRKKYGTTPKEYRNRVRDMR